MYTSKDETAKTSLYFAIEKGDERIIKLLLSNKNIDINQESVIENNYFYKKEINQKSPLFLAVEKENEEIVRLLLEHEDLEINSKSVFIFEKAQSKYKSTEEKTPLYLAVETENIKIIKLLLSNDKIDVNSKYVFQESASSQYYLENAPIHIAVQNSNKEIIQLLLACETIDVNSLSISSYKNIEVEFLFEKSALKKALQNQDSEIVQLLLSHSKIDINMKLSKTMKKRDYEFNESSSVLYRQVAKNHFEMVKIFLTHPEIDVNLQATQKHERMALNYYLYQLPSDRVSPKFKDFIVKDDDRFYNPQFLEKAVLISMNKFFTPNFMSLKVKESNSVPPLARAIFERNIDIIKLLLNHPDIDVNIIIKDSVKIQKEFTFNYFPLYLAVLTKKEEIVSLLLNHSKIDVNKVKESKLYFNDKITLINKSNSLHLSVENGQQNIVQLFFQHPDTDVNAKLITFDIHIEEGTNIISNIEKNRLSLLGITLMTKNLKMASFLLSQKNIDVNEKYIYTYEILVKGKKLRLMEAYNGTVLFYAIEKKNIDFVKLLLSKKEVDVNILSMSKGFNRSDNKKAISSLLRLTPLHAAIKDKSPEIVNLLLSRPDINANSTIYVKKYDNCTMGGYIEYKGLKSNDLAHFYNVYKETPIQMAIKCGNIEILSLLLARKEININQKTIYKRQIEGVDDEFEKKEMTALISVIETDSTEMIELLLGREDIDVNIITKNKTVVKYIKKGREGVMYTFDERTALHHAIINNKMMMIARLIENEKINTNIKYVYRISKNGIEDVDSGEWTNADLINYQEDELFKMIMSPILEFFKKDEETINMINKDNEEENVENKDIKEEEEDFKDELKEEDLFDIDEEEEENPFKVTKLNSNQLFSLLTSVLHSYQNEEEDNNNNNNNNVEEEAKSIVDMAKSVDKINGNQKEDCLIS
ncbi:hypothetical protein M9Y10_020409 [Tritrichomonas musculus]|uniref:Ankyrin n=1 Tax=Tritrichomonas musculus TaxID=1915356 RepID=A0ABR2HIC9_9EUKA